MRFIPPDRGYQARLRRSLCELDPAFVAGFRPVPTGPYAKGYRLGLREVRDVIGGEAEIVRALPRTRFRNTFHEEAILPLSASICLEDFESELRASGLVKPDEVLVQSLSSPRKFRVAIGKVAGDVSDFTRREQGPALPPLPGSSARLRIPKASRKSIF